MSSSDSNDQHKLNQHKVAAPLKGLLRGIFLWAACAMTLHTTAAPQMDASGLGVGVGLRGLYVEWQQPTAHPDLTLSLGVQSYVKRQDKGSLILVRSI